LDFNFFIYYDQSKTQKDWIYIETHKTALQYESDQVGSDDMYSITARYATNKEKDNSWSIYYSGMYGSVKDNGDYYKSDGVGVFEGYLATNNYMRGQQHSLTFDGLSNFLQNKLQLKYGVYLGANILSDDTRNRDFGATSIQNSNHYQTTEFELRAYASAEYNFNQNTGLSIDLSFDHSGSKYKNSSSISGDNHATLTYSNFIPRVTYWYRASNYRLNLRLMTINNKPNFNYLLAGQRYVNNYLYTVGNPNLKNQITYTLQVGQTFWDLLTVNLYAGVIKDNIMPYYAMDANKQLYQSYANASDKFYATANITLPFAFFDKKLYGSINALFQKGIFYNIDPVLGINTPNVHQFVIVYNGNIYYDITQRLTVQARVSGSNRRVSTLQSRVSAGFSFSPAISYTFLKDESLTVELQANSFLGEIHDQQNFWNFVGNSYTTYNYSMPQYELKISYRLNRGKEIRRQDNIGDFGRMLKQ
ncbi:MAG: outer membrane beta-barrel protein, partial [Mucinivorans sp.]